MAPKKKKSIHDNISKQEFQQDMSLLFSNLSTHHMATLDVTFKKFWDAVISEHRLMKILMRP